MRTNRDRMSWCLAGAAIGGSLGTSAAVMGGGIVLFAISEGWEDGRFEWWYLAVVTAGGLAGTACGAVAGLLRHRFRPLAAAGQTRRTPTAPGRAGE